MDKAQQMRVSPQPVAVDATVAAVTAAFGHASKLLQQIKSQPTQVDADKYLQPLEESISRGLRSIDNEWDEGTERFGAAYELGDRYTAWELQKIVTEQRVMLIGALRAALEDPSHEHLEVALNASDLARKEAVRSLTDLYRRLLQKPPATKVPSVKRFPSGKIVQKRMTFLNMSSPDAKSNSISSFAEVHELSFLNEYRKSGQSLRPDSEDYDTKRRGRQSSLFAKFRHPSDVSNMKSPLPSYKSASTLTLEGLPTPAQTSHEMTFFDDATTPKYPSALQSNFKFPHESMMSESSVAKEGNLTPIQDESPPEDAERSELSPGTSSSQQDYNFPRINIQSSDFHAGPIKLSEDSKAVLEDLPSEEAVRHFSRSFLKPRGLDPDAGSQDEHDKRIDSLLQQLHSLDVSRHFSTSTAGSELSHISFPEHAVRSSAMSSESDFFIAGTEVRLSKPPPAPKEPPPPTPALDVVNEEEDEQSPTTAQRDASVSTLVSTETVRPDSSMLSPKSTSTSPEPPPQNLYHNASAPAATHQIPPIPRAPSSPKASSEDGHKHHHHHHQHKGRRPSTTYLPTPSPENNYLDFCPSAVRLQVGERDALKPTGIMGPVISRGTSNMCSNAKCAFREAGSSDAKIWEHDGVRFRRAFFAKSHVQMRKARNGMFMYQCMFCAFQGLMGTSSQLLGANALLEHVASHRGQDIDDMVLERARCVMGRVAREDEPFDVNLTPLPGEIKKHVQQATKVAGAGDKKDIEAVATAAIQQTLPKPPILGQPPGARTGVVADKTAKSSAWLNDFSKSDSSSSGISVAAS